MSKTEKVYQALLSKVQDALEQLAKGDRSVLLVLWAGRGGGKTTVLNLLRERYATAKDISLLGPWDARSYSFQVLASQVLSALESSPAESRKLILLDNLDELLRTDNGEPFFAFEKDVVRELVARRDTLTVVTSRVPLIQWRDPDVRSAMGNLHISPLSREDVEEWAETRRLDPERAFALSLGHPQVLAWLQEQPDLSQEEVDRKVSRFFLESLSDRARRLAEVASLFPSFDFAVLHLVLSTGEDEESFYGEYMEHMEELMGTGLVYWDGEMGAYRFRESAVRRLLANVFLHDDPERFRSIHRTAAEYYREAARRAAYLHRTLVSALYHTAQAEGEKARQVCVKWVEDTVGIWLGAPWEEVRKAWETGAEDETVREEIQERIGVAAFEHITRLLESAAQSAARLVAQVKEEVKR